MELNKAICLLDGVIGGLIGIKALIGHAPPTNIKNKFNYFVKTTIELDENSYNKFVQEFKEYFGEIEDIDISDFPYGGFQFSIKNVK